MFDVYTFGSGSYVVEALHAVKMFMGSSSYTTLARIAGLIALLWVLLAALRNKGGGAIQADWSWLLFFMFFYVGLIVPKVDVVIIDEIDPPTGASPVVTGVPLGMGALAYITSTIGHGLTDKYETFITIPGDQKYSQNGMLFGANVMRSLGEMEFPDAGYSSDMNQFIGHCMFPQITAGGLSLDALTTSTDLWQYLKGNAQTNRWIEFSDGVVWTCLEAANDLDARINPQVNTAAGQAGQKLWPTKGASAAQAAFLASAGGTTAADFIGITQTGADMTRQAMMVKAISGALEGASIDADNQSMAQAIYQAKGEAQQRNMYLSMGSMASRTLPVMKAVMEAVAYGIAPLVFLFVLMPGGLVALGQYAMFMMWLQMWPILYAIINSVMYWYGSQASTNAAALSDGSHGLTLESMNSVFAANADMTALAGYMALSIPMISYMLLKGGMSAGGAVYSSLMQPANSTASSTAAEQTSGTLAMNSLTMDTSAWGNMNANKMDINRGMAWGMTSVTEANTGTTYTSLGSSGNTAVSMAQGISSYAFGTQLSGKVAEGLTTKAESSMQAAKSDSVEALKASGAAYNSMQSLSNELQASITNGSAHKTEASTQLQTALQNTDKANTALAHSLKTDTQTAAKILAGIAANKAFMKSKDDNFSIDAKLAGDLTGVAMSAENWSKADQFAKETNYAENLSAAKSAANTLSSTQQEGVSDKTAATVQTSISESANLSNKAAASRQVAESYAVAASHAQEVSLTTGGDITNEMLGKLGFDQREFVGLQSAAASGNDGGAARHQIEDLKQQYIDSFGNDAGLKGAPTADKVGAKWDSDSHAVTQSGTDLINRHDAVNQERLDAHKAEAGLPTRGEIEANAAARQGATDGQMSANQSRLDVGKTALHDKQAKEAGEMEHNAERGTIETATDATVKNAKELAYAADTLATKAYNATNESVTNPALALVGMEPLKKVDEPEPLPKSMERFSEFRADEDFAQKKSPVSDGAGDVPSGNPVQGGGRLGSGFGFRHHPLSGVWKQHKGIDIAAPRGTPVETRADGVVKFAGQQGGYGNLVIIDHGNGVETRYGHLNSFALNMKKGQTVHEGDMIGTVGSTGDSTGNHLHYEVRESGQAVNPRKFMG